VPSLVVYLDSSDYSKLSDPRRATEPEILRVKEFLLEHVASGAIEIRYSMIHIVEACHRTDSSRDLAIARAALIDDLSRKRVLRHLTDVIADERTAQPGNRTIAFDDHGHWFPRLEGYGSKLSNSLKDGLRDGFARVPMNRKQRRYVEKKYGPRTNPRWDAIAQLVGADATKDIESQYGVSRRFIEQRVLPSLVRNIEDEARLEREVFEEVFNPLRFIANYLDPNDDRGKLRKSVSSIGDKLVDSVSTFKRDVSAAIENYGREAVERASTGFRIDGEERRQRLKQVLIASSIRNRRCDQQSPDLQDSQCNASAGVDALTHAFDLWMMDAFQLQNPRSVRVSDAGDLLHLFYLPYVDVWRGDGYSVSIANRLRSHVKAIAVQDLFSLPEVIRSQLVGHRPG
jgi:hypothetical protein